MCCYPRLTSSIHGVSSFRSQLHPLVRIWSPLAQRNQDGNGHNATLEFTNQRIVLRLIKMQSLQKKKTAVGTGIEYLCAVSSCEAYLVEAESTGMTNILQVDGGSKEECEPAV